MRLIALGKIAAPLGAVAMVLISPSASLGVDAANPARPAHQSYISEEMRPVEPECLIMDSWDIGILLGEMVGDGLSYQPYREFCDRNVRSECQSIIDEFIRIVRDTPNCVIQPNHPLMYAGCLERGYERCADRPWFGFETMTPPAGAKKQASKADCLKTITNFCTERAALAGVEPPSLEEWMRICNDRLASTCDELP